MFKEYVLRGTFKRANTARKRITEGIQDPCVVLRNSGVMIKKSVPHPQGYEISLFEDPLNLPLDRILRGFKFTVRNGKIYVEFRENR